MYFETKQNQKPNKSKQKKKKNKNNSFHTHTHENMLQAQNKCRSICYIQEKCPILFLFVVTKIWIQSLKYKNEKKLKKDDVDDDDDEEEEEDEEKKASICHDTVNLSIKHTHIFTYDVWERNNRIKTLFFLYVFVCFFFIKSATNPFRLSNKTF